MRRVQTYGQAVGNSSGPGGLTAAARKFRVTETAERMTADVMTGDGAVCSGSGEERREQWRRRANDRQTTTPPRPIGGGGARAEKTVIATLPCAADRRDRAVRGRGTRRRPSGNAAPGHYYSDCRLRRPGDPLRPYENSGPGPRTADCLRDFRAISYFARKKAGRQSPVWPPVPAPLAVTLYVPAAVTVVF